LTRDTWINGSNSSYQAAIELAIFEILNNVQYKTVPRTSELCLYRKYSIHRILLFWAKGNP
jgi:hypothetical protein